MVVLEVQGPNQGKREKENLHQIINAIGKITMKGQESKEPLGGKDLLYLME